MLRSPNNSRLLKPSRPSTLSLWKDPVNDLHDTDELLMGSSSMEEVAQLVHTAPPGFQVQPPLQLSLSQTLSLGPSVLGWQVLVEGAEGSFIGYLCWLLDHCARLGLEQASRAESGVRRVGVLLLSYSHITSVTLLAKRANLPRSRPHAAKSGVVEEKQGRSLLMRKLVAPHLADKQDRSDDDGEDSGDEGGDIPPFPPPALRLSRPSSWTVIDCVDESYREALSAIGGEGQVGLSAVGHNLGRWGSLAWLAVATPHTVYLFDAATLGLLPLLLGATAGSEKPPCKPRRRPRETEDALKQGNNEHDGTNTIADDYSHKNLHSKLNTCENNLLTSEGYNSSPSNQELTSMCPSEALVTNFESKTPVWGSGPVLPHLPPEDDHAPPRLRDQPSEPEPLDVQEEPRHRCLKDVLEDPYLEKVVHDSRNLQDFLQHKAGFTITALFDTQATEVYLYIILNSGDSPAFVPSLSSLLQRRLHLAPQHLLYERVQRSVAEDSSAFLERPLDARTLQGIASSAAFLCELRALQLRDALADLRQLTALHCHAHALMDDLMRPRVEQHVVPTAVQRLGRQTVLHYSYSGSLTQRRT